MQPRYVLAVPVDGPEGSPFYEISDTEKDRPVATMRGDVPGVNVKEFMENLLNVMNGMAS